MVSFFTNAMVNFMCQLDWATRCSDILSNIIRCVCEGGLDDTNIWISRLSEDYFPIVTGPHPMDWRTPDRTKRLTLLWVIGNSSCLMAWDGILVLFSAFRFRLKHCLFLVLSLSISSPSSQTFRFGLVLHQRLSWVSSLLSLHYHSSTFI